MSVASHVFKIELRRSDAKLPRFFSHLVKRITSPYRYAIIPTQSIVSSHSNWALKTTKTKHNYDRGLRLQTFIVSAHQIIKTNKRHKSRNYTGTPTGPGSPASPRLPYKINHNLGQLVTTQTNAEIKEFHLKETVTVRTIQAPEIQIEK